MQRRAGPIFRLSYIILVYHKNPMFMYYFETVSQKNKSPRFLSSNTLLIWCFSQEAVQLYATYYIVGIHFAHRQIRSPVELRVSSSITLLLVVILRKLYCCSFYSKTKVEAFPHFHVSSSLALSFSTPLGKFHFLLRRVYLQLT